MFITRCLITGDYVDNWITGLSCCYRNPYLLVSKLQIKTVALSQSRSRDGRGTQVLLLSRMGYLGVRALHVSRVARDPIDGHHTWYSGAKSFLASCRPFARVIFLLLSVHLQEYVCGPKNVPCSWGRAINIVNRYVYVSQPDKDRVLVISEAQMMIIDVRVVLWPLQRRNDLPIISMTLIT